MVKIINIRFSDDEYENLQRLSSSLGYPDISKCIRGVISEKLKGVPDEGIKSAVLEVLKTDKDVLDMFQEIVDSAIKTAFQNLMTK